MRKLLVASVLLLSLMGCGSSGDDGDNIPQTASNIEDGSSLDRELRFPVNLIHVIGDAGLNDAEALEVFDLAAGIISRDMPVKLHIASMETILNPFPEFLIQHGETFSQDQNFQSWKEWAARESRIKAGEVTVVLLPAYQRDGRRLIGGVANGHCTLSRGSFAMLALTPVSAEGQSRLRKSANALAHEIGHVLGAGHNDAERELMNSSHQEHGEEELRFSAQSLSQIASCLNPAS